MDLVFLMNLNQKFGGGGYSVFKFAEYLARLQHNVLILYVTHPEFLKKQRQIPKLTIKKGLLLPRFKSLNLKIEKLYDYFFLEQYLKRHGNDIDYLVGYQRRMAIKVAKLGGKYGIKTVNFIFETPVWLEKQWGEEWKKSYKNPKLKRSWHQFNIALKNSNLIFAISRLTAKETARWIGRYPDGVIYPGFTPPIFTSQKVSKQPNQIIYIGRLYRNKNVDEIIRAISKLSIPLKLVICGDGNEKKKLIELSTKLNVKCEFKGTVREQEKWKLISESKFMVFPSSFEGFGIPPMEALACGIPCICANIPIIREAYDDKVEYFEGHNIKQLRKKIQYLLDNPDYCRKRGEEGKKYVTKKFGWIKSAKKMENLLKGRL